MSTIKRYYEDCHLERFTAQVTGCEETPKGYRITLDATAFYPEGGGQACDTGILGQATVLDVREQDDEIIHLCDKPLPVGGIVEGKLHWDRRFDLMQQHTGEHIVSGIIHRRYGYHNVGFHIGADMVTIDFDGPIPLEALKEIEQEANGAVWKNLPVHCWYPTEAELPQVPYRKKRELPWPVRIVQIPNVDSCACCGVHVANTGEVGLIKLFSCVKFHQGVRIEMACGGRALAYLSRVYEQNKLVSQSFSAKLLKTGDAALRMNESLAAEKFRATGLQKRLFSAIAQGYAGQENALHFETSLPPAGVRELAEAIADSISGVAAVFSGEGQTYHVCLASRTADIKELGSRMAKTLNGRGGGKPGFFQGTVQAEKSEICAFFSWE